VLKIAMGSWLDATVALQSIHRVELRVLRMHSSLANVLCILLLQVACLAAEQQKVVLPSASQLGANEVNW